MRHAADPDHVIAVSTIVSREHSIAKAGLIGVLWGCGHTVTIVAVGAAIILFGLAVPVRVGLTMEFSVGVMLILLGVLNLTGAMKWISEEFFPAHPRVAGEHAHVHEHGNRVHYHWHAHVPAENHHEESLTPPRWLTHAKALGGPFERLGLFPVLRPLLAGIVHGLAGSAAVALLVLSTIHDPKWAVLYLLIFGTGTIAGMMLITVALALPFSLTGYKFPWLTRGLVVASGLLSLGFGLSFSTRSGLLEACSPGIPTAHPADPGSNFGGLS